MPTLMWYETNYIIWSRGFTPTDWSAHPSIHLSIHDPTPILTCMPTMQSACLLQIGCLENRFNAFFMCQLCANNWSPFDLLSILGNNHSPNLSWLIQRNFLHFFLSSVKLGEGSTILHVVWLFSFVILHWWISRQKVPKSTKQELLGCHSVVSWMDWFWADLGRRWIPSLKAAKCARSMWTSAFSVPRAISGTWGSELCAGSLSLASHQWLNLWLVAKSSSQWLLAKSLNWKSIWQRFSHST